MDLKISGKTAVVIGASRGLGAEIAISLAKEGAMVVAAARNIEELNVLKNKHGINIKFLDLADKHSVDEFVREITKDNVDILLNNCGGPLAGSTESQTLESWKDTFSTMATPIFQITKAIVPKMVSRKWGRIITIGSSGIQQPIDNLALSNSIRGAIAGWSKTLANEVAQHGITVNMVLPGRIETNRLKELDLGKAQRTNKTVEEIENQSKSMIPIGRYGRPEEFAAVCTFLASDLASYITGSMIRVDGGLTKSI